MIFQLTSAMLEACVLAVLTQGDTYGYVLTQKVKTVLEISDSTLYPVLRRLQKTGYLETYDQSYQGRNRRYYTITNSGQQKCVEYQQEWQLYKEKLDQILLGGLSDD